MSVQRRPVSGGWVEWLLRPQIGCSLLKKKVFLLSESLFAFASLWESRLLKDDRAKSNILNLAAKWGLPTIPQSINRPLADPGLVVLSFPKPGSAGFTRAIPTRKGTCKSVVFHACHRQIYLPCWRSGVGRLGAKVRPKAIQATIKSEARKPRVGDRHKEERFPCWGKFPLHLIAFPELECFQKTTRVSGYECHSETGIHSSPSALWSAIREQD